MSQEKKDKIRHDMKHIAYLIKGLLEAFDELNKDVENGIETDEQEVSSSRNSDNLD